MQNLVSTSSKLLLVKSNKDITARARISEERQVQVD